MRFGGLPPRRPDQLTAPGQAGIAPGSSSGGVVRARQVIVFGPGGGEFVYNAAGTQLLAANVGAVTTDPILHKTVQQGFSTFNGHGAVVNLLSSALGAFFQYQDLGTSTQGPLILVTASSSGIDPITGTSYSFGTTGINPAFGSFIQLLGSAIVIGIASVFSRNAQVFVQGGSGSSPPFWENDSPEQTTASHAALQLQGASPDGTRPAQVLVGFAAGSAALTRATNARVELQGDVSQLAMSGITTGNVANSINETTIASFTIPASEAAATTIYDLTAHGNVQCSLASNLTLRLRVTGPAGALILATATFACTVAAGTNRDWSADFKLAFRGAGNTNMDVWGQFIETISAAGGAATGRPGIGPFAPANDTAAVVIAVTAQFSVANAGNSANGIDGSMNRRNL